MKWGMEGGGTLTFERTPPFSNEKENIVGLLTVKLSTSRSGAEFHIEFYQ